MSLLVVGSMAFDSIRSPFGEVEKVVGGSATYFSLAASYLAPVRLVSVVGTDFPREMIETLASRRIDVRGLKISEGKTFHWKGFYEYDLNTAHTVTTELHVFRDFPPLPALREGTPNAVENHRADDQKAHSLAPLPKGIRSYPTTARGALK